jgi:hypothetical protein
VQDNPYQYYTAGREYYISEDSPVQKHFQPLEELSAKEGERVVEEKIASPEVDPKRGGARKGRSESHHGSGYAEVQG